MPRTCAEERGARRVSALSHGVVFGYEGFRTGGAMVRRVESFDSTTGEIKEKKEYVMLVGLQNKDLFDWESEFVSQDNRYYVPDVEAVKRAPTTNINQGELAMLQILDRGIGQRFDGMARIAEAANPFGERRRVRERRVKKAGTSGSLRDRHDQLSSVGPDPHLQGVEPKRITPPMFGTMPSL